MLKDYDKHFAVSLTPETSQDKPNKLSWFEQLEAQNYGFTRIQKLANNIGLIDFWGFAQFTELFRG